MEKLTTIFRAVLTHSVTKSSAIVMAGSMLANFLAYLYHLIVGRILGPERYGELAALLSLFYILNVPSLGLQATLTKYFSSLHARRKPGEVKTLFFMATRWVLLGEVAGLLVVVVSLDTLANFLHIFTKEYFIWLYFIFSTYLLTVIQLSTFQAHQLFFTANIYTNLGMILRLALGAFGAWFGVGATLLTNVLSNAMTYVVSFVPLGFVIKQRSQPLTISRRSALGYSIPTLLTTLGVTALYSQDVLLVKHFFSAREAGLYSALSVLGKVIFYASSALGFVLFPVVAERTELRKGHHRLVWFGLTAIAGISLSLTAIYFLFPTLVVDLLFGKAFYEATPYLGYFGLFITFFSLASLLCNVCLAAGKTLVWVLALAGAASQTLLIWLFHQSLFLVIAMNMSVSAGLFLLLLLYYNHVKERA